MPSLSSHKLWRGRGSKSELSEGLWKKVLQWPETWGASLAPVSWHSPMRLAAMLYDCTTRLESRKGTWVSGAFPSTEWGAEPTRAPRCVLWQGSHNILVLSPMSSPISPLQLFLLPLCSPLYALGRLWLTFQEQIQPMPPERASKRWWEMFLQPLLFSHHTFGHWALLTLLFVQRSLWYETLPVAVCYVLGKRNSRDLLTSCFGKER